MTIIMPVCVAAIAGTTDSARTNARARTVTFFIGLLLCPRSSFGSEAVATEIYDLSKLPRTANGIDTPIRPTFFHLP
jgi:hypothetical protein